MKKIATMILVVTLALTMLLTIVACGGGDTPVAPPPAEETTPEPTPEAPPEPDDGLVEIPDLLQMNWDEAQVILSDLGLAVESSRNLFYVTDGVRVIEMDPEPGTRVEPGSLVQVVISLLDQGEIEIVQARRGIFEGNVYTSEYLGIRIELPPEFSSLTSEERFAWHIDYMGFDPIDFLEEVPPSIWDEMHGGFLTDFSAMESHFGNISVAYGKLLELQLNWDALAYLEDFASTRHSFFGDVEGVSMTQNINTTPIRIGDNDWYLHTERLLQPHMYLDMIMLVNIYGGFVRQIYLSSSLSIQEEVDDIDKRWELVFADPNFIEYDIDTILSWITPYP